jgi:phage head maturation protease
MQRKSVPLLIKSADDDSDTFTGLASVFDNLDHDGDIVRRGAFSRSLGSGTHRYCGLDAQGDDPRCYVRDVVEATETNDGLAIKGRF